MVELKKIATEQRNPNTMNIDTLSTLDMVKLINREDHKVAEAVGLVRDKIAQAVDAIAEAFDAGMMETVSTEHLADVVAAVEKADSNRHE